ncbi:hypothetical protein C8J57DRAFT_1717122 [Mycena rebaudengoi]|nr:hypothetical protein C8J57DRAFT_1717122 [Mycena rebaudengoi]
MAPTLWFRPRQMTTWIFTSSSTTPPHESTPPPPPAPSSVSKGKAKGKAPAAPPAAPPTAPAAGSSKAAIHAVFNAAGFIPGETEVPKKTSHAFHQAIRDDLDNTLTQLAKTDDKVRALQQETGEMIQRVFPTLYLHEYSLKTPAVFNAQMDGFADELRVRIADALTQQDIADLADRVSRHGNDTLSDLIHASNKHGENFAASATAIANIGSRVQGLEDTVAVQINQLATSVGFLQSSVDSMRTTIESVAVRVAAAPALGAVVAPPPAAVPAPVAPAIAEIDAEQTRILFKQFLASSGKHAREEDLSDTVRNVRPRAGEAAQPTLIVPPTFAYTPPVPAPTAAAPAPITTPPAAPVTPPVAPLGPPVAAALPAPPAPTAHAAPPRAATRPPPKTDPKCDIIFGPLTWTKERGERGRIVNVKEDVMNVLKVVFKGVYDLSGLRIRTRPVEEDGAYTICTFDTPAMADWLVTDWAKANRGTYIHVTATHLNA